MFQMKAQDKTPEELSEVEMANLPEKDFSNDCKDDPRAWEKNGCTQQEVTRSF